MNGKGKIIFIKIILVTKVTKPSVGIISLKNLSP